MKKHFSTLAFLLVSIISFAQDNNSRASIIGSEVGKIVGIALVAGLFIWGISRLVKKSK